MIGIIGGIAPFSGIDIVQKIIQETVANTEREHLPLLLSSQPHRIPVIEDYFNAEVDTLNPSQAIMSIVSQLERAGVTHLVIASTIAHSPKIFDLVENEIREKMPHISLINVIDEVTLYIQEHHFGSKVGILSTKSIQNEAIFSSKLASLGIEFIESNEEDQSKIQEAIFNETFGIKNHYPPITHRAHDLIISAAENLKKSGAQVIVLASPAFLLALRDSEMFGVPLLDPNRIVARSLIAKLAPEKLKSL